MAAMLNDHASRATGGGHTSEFQVVSNHLARIEI